MTHLFIIWDTADQTQGFAHVIYSKLFSTSYPTLQWNTIFIHKNKVNPSLQFEYLAPILLNLG